jgi:hypothetical protein
MTAPGGGKPDAHWRGWWPLIAATIVYAVVLSVVAALRAESTSDFRDYWQTARHFRETGELSVEFGVHNYLPFFPILMIPWSFLPLRVAVVAFTFLSLGLLALTAVMADVLLHERLGPRPRRATLITLGLMLAYVHSCAVLGAVGLLLTFLVVATWFLFERGREWPAGAALGLATLIKVVPGLLILFFLLKGRWRVAVAAVAVCAVLGVGLPLASLGAPEFVRQHEGFYARAVREHSAWATIVGDQPRKVFYKNNALPTVLRRLLTPINSAPDDKGTQLFINVADLPRRVIFGVYAAVMLVFLAGSVAAALCPPRGQVHDADEVPALRAQFGVWCCLMLLASPLLWIHYLPMAYWPLAVVVDRAERQRETRGQASRWCVAALLIWLLGAMLLAWPAARAAGAQLAALACLWLAATILAFRKTSQGAGRNGTPPHANSE